MDADRPTHREPHRLRPGPIVLGMFALLAIVAIGAGRPPGGEPGGGWARLELSLSEAVTTLIVIAAIVDVAIVILALWKRGHVVRLAPRRKGWMMRMLRFLVIFAVVMFIASALSPDEADRDTVESAEVDVLEEPTTETAPWKWAVLVAGLAVGAGVVWFGTRDSRPRQADQLRQAEPRPTDRASTIDTWSYAVPVGDDPHSRVIQAYAAMEETLADVGLRRRASEAPLEFANRIGILLPEAAAFVTNLTDLFTLARFSRHEIDRPMATRASETLAGLVANVETSRV